MPDDVAVTLREPAGAPPAAAADDSPPPAHPPPPAAAAEWAAALDAVVPAVVVLKVTATRAFDTEAAGSSYATGFVVDAVRGVLLTNRHVVSTGPTTAEAIFHDREEVALRTLYADPVHDYGFFAFDPAALHFMTPSSIPLAPDGARVGLDVRVVGNDSGEKVSILAGTLARLDRDAPSYGRRGYNDFNTYYIQAASGTKGGSSGSPVVDARGRAVALNAGGRTKAASAFYLPLHRVARTLAALQAAYDAAGGRWDGPPAVVPRGDLQATFAFKGFDECRRLGLTEPSEAALRAAAAGPGGGGAAADAASVGTGALAVDACVPGGPAARAGLAPGDILLSVDGLPLVHFLPLEAALDDAVGRAVAVVVERGGARVEASVAVQDLHAVTPAAFLEAAGAVLHRTSYQMARNHRAPAGGLFVAEPGHVLGRAGVPRHAIVTSLNHVPTPTAAAFAAVLAAAAEGARLPVKYVTFADRGRPRVALASADRAWFGPAVFWARDDAAGAWVASAEPPAECVRGVEEEAAAGGAAPDAAPATAPPPPPPPPPPPRPATPDADAALRACLATVEVHIPAVALADGVHSRAFTGAALVVALTPTLGLAAVDRNTVPVAAADIRLAFGGAPVEAAAHPCFLHPLHNVALLAFDPASLPPSARAAIAAATLDTAPLLPGAPVDLAGLARDGRLVRRRAAVVDPAHQLVLASPDVPRFRAVHETVVKLEHAYASSAGVLVTRAGAVAALWASFAEQVAREEREFCAGLPAAAFARWVAAAAASLAAPRHVRAARPLSVPVMDAELHPIPLAKAVGHGLPPEWAAALAAAGGGARSALRVRAALPGSPAAAALEPGDILLAIDGVPVVDYRGLEAAVAAAGGGGGAPATLSLTLCRAGAVVAAAVATATEPALATTRLVHWAGAQLQAPHRGVRELGHAPPAGGAGVYVSRWHHGSPAHRYGLFALNWVTSVNGQVRRGGGGRRARARTPPTTPPHPQPTPDLDAFLAAVAPLPHAAPVRLGLVHAESTKPAVLTLKTDLRYWPTTTLTLPPGADPTAAAGGWVRGVVGAVEGGVATGAARARGARALLVGARPGPPAV